MTRLVVALVLCLLLTGSAWAEDNTPQTGQATADSSSSWDFSLRPYFYLSGVSGSVTAEPITIPINSKFSDLLDNVRVGLFLAFAAEKGQWGLYTDFAYINLVGKGTGSLETELELENLIAEADVTLRPSPGSTLKFLGGVRVYWVQETLSIQGQPLPEANTTVIDPILGAQGSWPLGTRWDFQMRGDIGGFGVSSEFTYQLMTMFRWHISSSVSLPFGYRVLGYQIQDGNIRMNTRMGGMVVGLDFRF